MTYAQARRDHEYLWSTYCAADDMTGGYVESEDLDRLLRKPTKATARGIYVDQILHWFDAGPEVLCLRKNGWETDPEVAAIAERHDAATHRLKEEARQ